MCNDHDVNFDKQKLLDEYDLSKLNNCAYNTKLKLYKYANK